MEIITLCGSTRFKKAFEEWNARLSLQGNIVFSVICFGHCLNIPLTDSEKRTADQVHLKKIDMSDSIFVLDVGGYIGESTHREIAYVAERGKRVRWLSNEYPEWSEEDSRFTHI